MSARGQRETPKFSAPPLNQTKTPPHHALAFESGIIAMYDSYTYETRYKVTIVSIQRSLSSTFPIGLQTPTKSSRKECRPVFALARSDREIRMKKWTLMGYCTAKNVSRSRCNLEIQASPLGVAEAVRFALHASLKWSRKISSIIS